MNISRLGRLLTLALPLIVAQLAQNAVPFISTLVIGRANPADLAGMALAAVVFGVALNASSGIMFSVAPTVSQALGGGRTDEAGQTFRSAVWLGGTVGVVALLAAYFAPGLLQALGQQPHTVTAAAEYLHFAAFGLPFLVFAIVLRGYFEGSGNTRPIMYVAFFAVLIHGVTSALLVLGSPALGLRGVGISSVLAYAGMAAALLAIFTRAHPDVIRGSYRPNLRIIWELFTLGLPIGLTVTFEVGVFSATAFVMGYFGDLFLSAHQVAIQSASMAFMVPLGIASATSILVGRARGARDLPAATQAGWLGVLVACSFSLIAASLFLLAPHVVIGIFVDIADPANHELVYHARRFLAVAGAFQIVDSAQAAAIGSLRGLKDAAVPMVLTLVAYWVVGFGSSLLLAYPLGLGPIGLWIGLTIGLGTAAALLLTRFRLLTRALARREASAMISND